MVGIVVVTRAALLIARQASTWTIDEHSGERIERPAFGDLRFEAIPQVGKPLRI